MWVTNMTVWALAGLGILTAGILLWIGPWCAALGLSLKGYLSAISLFLGGAVLGFFMAPVTHLAAIIALAVAGMGALGMIIAETQ